MKKDSDFDTEFYVYGLFNGRLYFRGIRASHIFVDPVDGKWTIQSLKSPGKISKILSDGHSSEHYPIGRLQWTVQNNYTDLGKYIFIKVRRNPSEFNTVLSSHVFSL